MSKASEYAKAVQGLQIKRPDVRVEDSGDLVARVLNSGYLEITYRAPIAPDQAIKLAHWIIDTFGETE